MYSVVIPVHNAQACLERCVESWLSQTRGDLELILVDDGSEDASPALCDAFAERDGRVRVIHQANAGVSAARNAGIEAAEGTYLLFTDSDDYVEPNLLEKLGQCMEDAGADLALCGYHHLYDGADILKLPGTTGVFSLRDGEEEFLRLYEQGFLNMPWNKIYKREKAGRFDTSLSLGEDLLFNLNYLEQCEKAAVLSEPLCFYIQEEQKTTLSSEKRKDRLELARRICRETEQFYDRHWKTGGETGHRRIFTRYMNEVMDECEKLPGDKSLSAREKLRAVRALAEDPWVQKRGDEARFSHADYRILWPFLRRKRAVCVYVLCVLRRMVVRAVHRVRRMRRGTAGWNL